MKDDLARDAFQHLPRLVVFVEVARQKTFRGAAETLGLSPSTITHHIQKLEETLGVRLVERTSRALSLTAAGATLLEDAGALLEAWNRGVTRTRDQGDDPAGTLVVTAPDVLVERFVTPALAVLVESHPRLTVDLRVGADTLQLVDEGIHVAVRIGPLPDSSYGAHSLWRDEMGVFAAPTLAEPVLTPTGLTGAPWIHFSMRSHPTELRLQKDGEAASIEPTVRVRVNTGAAKIQLASAGVGFGLFPTRLVAREVESGQLVRVLPEWSAGAADFYVVTPSPRPRSAAVRAFGDALKRVVEQVL